MKKFLFAIAWVAIICCAVDVGWTIGADDFRPVSAPREYTNRDVCDRLDKLIRLQETNNQTMNSILSEIRSLRRR